MSLNIPLAVRIYDVPRGLDHMVTKWVEDFSFRHTAPGGCASCTIKLHIPRDLPIDPQTWGKLFTRVQIIDKRDAEVLWEGRVEDPARKSGEDIWELGVLGAAVVATDITIPYIYVDNTLEHWEPMEADAFEHKKEDINKTLTTRLNSSYVFNAGVQYGLWTWTGGSKCGTPIARITCTYNGTGPNGTQDDFFDQILNGSIYGNLDVTSFNVAGDTTKVNLVMNDAQFPDGLINQVYFDIRRNSTDYTVGSNDQIIARHKNPRIQGFRVNRKAEVLGAASDYSQGDFVYVRQVVEDVIGRWLIGVWNAGPFLLEPGSFFSSDSYAGSVSYKNAYVDISDNTKITNLQFVNGATAKDVLETLMTVQTNAYWAIWPSEHMYGYDVLNTTYDDTRFRFEWATWPNSWNYMVSSDGGMDEQVSAEDTYNGLWIRQTFDSSDEPFITPTTPQGPWPVPGLVWDEEPLKYRFRRIQFRDESSNPLPQGSDNYAIAYAEGAQLGGLKNAGTITIRGPIWCYDSGANSAYSTMGMVQPWEIRPGKLVYIRDVMPDAQAGNMSRQRVQVNDNPTFETNTADWSGTGGTLVRVTDQKHLGTASARITPTGAAADTFIATAWKPMDGGTLYEISGWIRCAVSRSITLRLDFYDATPTFLGNISKTITVSANTWTRFKVSGVSPLGTTQGPMLAIMSGTPAASNIMWLDDAYLIRVGKIPASHQNTVFRVAATNYNVSDNSCQMELDQLPKWNVATQIANPDSGSVSTR